MNLSSVAIQGELASFHHTAALQLLGEDTVIVPRQTFGEVFDTLKSGRVTYAVVATENSLYGPIQEVHDLLSNHGFRELQELWLPIEQCLLGLTGTSLTTIDTVLSHPVALAQCQDFLSLNLPQARRLEHADTAGAARDVHFWQDPTKAAIASADAAELIGLSVLARNINDQPDNRTRFVLLSR